jgi:hydroxymethylpyrimidine/phosphomethylpyrimidine kinase
MGQYIPDRMFWARDEEDPIIIPGDGSVKAH